MKVIAQIDSDKVLCEVSASEIGRLYNTTGPYDSKWEKNWINVGRVHDLQSAYHAVDTLRSFDEKRLRYLKQQIDQMTQSYDQIVTAYEKLMLFDTLKEAGTEEK
jgi:hypothetical protein